MLHLLPASAVVPAAGAGANAGAGAGAGAVPQTQAAMMAVNAREVGSGGAAGAAAAAAGGGAAAVAAGAGAGAGEGVQRPWLATLGARGVALSARPGLSEHRWLIAQPPPLPQRAEGAAQKRARPAT